MRVEKQPAITWIFEEGTFVPVAKLTANENQSIVTNYMGTPEAMYDSEGNRTWSCDLDGFGRVRKFTGRLSDCPFRYQGQYEDEETGLYYNRFRYYSPEMGGYISQDPIRLRGASSFYSYVNNPNGWVDCWGLLQGLVMAGNASGPSLARNPQDIVPDEHGMVKSQVGVAEPMGKSSFDRPENMAKVLKGTKVHEITSNTLPEGLAVKADGSDVGGTRAKGHHTIYPTQDMSFDEFNAKLSEIETKKIGVIDKDGNFSLCNN